MRNPRRPPPPSLPRRTATPSFESLGEACTDTTKRVASDVTYSPTSATGTAWEPTPWHATQRAAWEAHSMIGILSVVLLALLAVMGCAPSPSPPSAVATKRPVYVRDFLYDTSDAREHEERFIGGGEGPLRRVPQGRPISEAPVGRARRLATLLSKTIVHDLGEAGFHASRIASDAAPPADGWLIGGEFP